MEKNWGDTPSATLKFFELYSITIIFSNYPIPIDNTHQKTKLNKSCLLLGANFESVLPY